MEVKSKIHPFPFLPPPPTGSGLGGGGGLGLGKNSSSSSSSNNNHIKTMTTTTTPIMGGKKPTPMESSDSLFNPFLPEHIVKYKGLLQQIQAINAKTKKLTEAKTRWDNTARKVLLNQHNLGHTLLLSKKDQKAGVGLDLFREKKYTLPTSKIIKGKDYDDVEVAGAEEKGEQKWASSSTSTSTSTSSTTTKGSGNKTTLIDVPNLDGSSIKLKRTKKRMVLTEHTMKIGLAKYFLAAKLIPLNGGGEDGKIVALKLAHQATCMAAEGMGSRSTIQLRKLPVATLKQQEAKNKLEHHQISQLDSLLLSSSSSSSSSTSSSSTSSSSLSSIPSTSASASNNSSLLSSILGVGDQQDEQEQDDEEAAAVPVDEQEDDDEAPAED